jgi:hypothetical protein
VPAGAVPACRPAASPPRRRPSPASAQSPESAKSRARPRAAPWSRVPGRSRTGRPPPARPQSAKKTFLARSCQPPCHDVGCQKGRAHECQHRQQRRPLQRAQPADAVARRAAIAQPGAVAHQKAARQQLPHRNAGGLRCAIGKAQPPHQRAQHQAQGIDQAPATRIGKARLLEERPLHHERPGGRKHRAHAADQAGEDKQQRHRAADEQPAQQVVLPAEGKEGKGQVHGIC